MTLMLEIYLQKGDPMKRSKTIFSLLCLCTLFVSFEVDAHHSQGRRKDKSDGKLSADYVIVGGGTAGCVLARRLSEKHTVILLEDGLNEDNNPLISDPLASGGLVLDYTNEFFEPLGHAQVGAFPDNKRFPLVAGELLGGGSAVNGLQYVEGTPDFYKNWQQLVNDSAWGPENAFAVFKRIQTFNGVPGFFDPAVHGEHGPLDIRQASINVPASQQFVNGLVALGYDSIDDYNDPSTPNGAFIYWQLTEQPNKQRASSSTAYLEGYIKQKTCNVFVSCNRNLRVYTKAHADKILFSSREGCKQPIAKGLRAVIDDKQFDVFARRKVIVCAGTLISPLLLQSSGIGNETELTELCIPVVYHNPNVGQRLLNHPIIILTGLGHVLPPSSSDPEGLYSGGAFLPDPTKPSDQDRGFELIGIATPNAEVPELGAFTIATLLLDAKSKGYIRVLNSDFFRMPEYHTNFLTDSHDIDSLVAAYEIMFEALVSMGLVPIGPLPSDIEAVVEFVTTSYQQAYHYTGTCAMSQTPADGVVDSSGHVFGVKNLVIADNSIVPLNARGNTAGTAFLVGNVIADKLLAGKKNK